MTKFGLQLPNFTFSGVPDDAMFDHVADLAVAGEESGFDSVWVMDHYWQLPPLGGPTQPMLEGYTLLGGLAARTRRAKLGTLVTGVTYRNPALLAKMVTTLDIISRGRAVLGIGAAWYEEEHQALGFDFPPAGERLDRLEEALQICRTMFTEEAPSFHGKHYRIEKALNVPRPIRPGGPRIMVGGSGQKRTLRLVAQYADMCNIHGSPDTIRRLLDVLRAHCTDIGRDPDEITKTRLGGLFVAENEADLQRGLEQYAKQRSIPIDQVRGYVAAGTPEQLPDIVGEFLDAGLDGMLFNMTQAHEVEPVALAGKTLTSAFGG
jgi:F420-dependent oxidoreductase-like protein